VQVGPLIGGDGKLVGLKDEVEGGLGAVAVDVAGEFEFGVILVLGV